MITDQTYEHIVKNYGGRIRDLTIERIFIGRFLTAVRLSDGSTGTAATLCDDTPHCAKSARDFGIFTPGKFRGSRVTELFESQKDSSAVCSVRSAVLNAVSSGIIFSGRYRIIDNCDPIDLIDLEGERTIAIIGAFQSYIRKISGTCNRLFVLEMNENAITEEYRRFYIPSGDFKRVIPVSDVVIITGSALVNKTMDEILAVTRADSMVIVTGPSGSILPDQLFANNVSIIGAAKITDTELLFDIVSEGGTGYHLFEYCARKICILRDDKITVKREVD